MGRKRRRVKPHLARIRLDIDIEGVKIKPDMTIRRKGNKWYVRVMIDGKQREIGTGETDYNNALLKISTSIERYLKKQSPTLAEFSVDYMKWAENNKKPHTVACDRSKLKSILPVLGKTRLTELNTKQIEDYLNTRTVSKSTTTARSDFALISHMITKTMDWDLLDRNPLRRVKRPKKPEDRVRYLTKSELDRFLEACRISASKMLLPKVVTAITSGLRKSKVDNLTWDCIDLDNLLIWARDTKNGKDRRINIPPELVPVLLKLKHGNKTNSPYVFYRPDGRKSGNQRKAFETALKRAGIEDFRWHDLRHCYGTYHALNHTDIYVLKDLMGHSDIRTTLKYAHVTDIRKQEAAQTTFREMLGNLHNESVNDSVSDGIM